MAGYNASNYNEITMAKPKAGFNARPENINKEGRPPKGTSITETIKAMLEAKPEIKMALSNKILEMALKGDITAMKTLWQYMDGMPKQTTDMTINDLRGLMEVKYAKENNKLEPLADSSKSGQS